MKRNEYGTCYICGKPLNDDIEDRLGRHEECFNEYIESAPDWE